MSPFLPHGHQRLFMGWPWETEGKVHEAGRSPTVGSRARLGNPPTGIHFFYLTFVGFPPTEWTGGRWELISTNVRKEMCWRIPDFFFFFFVARAREPPRDDFQDIPLALGVKPRAPSLSWGNRQTRPWSQSLPGGYIPRVEKERGMLEVP